MSCRLRVLVDLWTRAQRNWPKSEGVTIEESRPRSSRRGPSVSPVGSRAQRALSSLASRFRRRGLTAEAFVFTACTIRDGAATYELCRAGVLCRQKRAVLGGHPGADAEEASRFTIWRMLKRAGHDMAGTGVREMRC